MEYRVYYKSLSGNTKILADYIGETLNCEVHNMREDHLYQESDLVFVGFWTDKGDCDEDVKAFLRTLKNQKIFLFGTAGFGEAETYFQRILTNVKKHIDDTNEVVGTFMCQGKMSMRVKERYTKMLEENPHDEHILGMIQNFEKALLHPSDEDLLMLNKQLIQFIK